MVERGGAVYEVPELGLALRGYEYAGHAVLDLVSIELPESD